MSKESTDVYAQVQENRTTSEFGPNYVAILNRSEIQILSNGKMETVDRPKACKIKVHGLE
jgi:hypothetical protein